MIAERFELPWLILKVGLLATLIHDHLYAKAGGTEYEIGGLVSHAGLDLLLLTVAMMAVTAATGPWTRPEARR